jgi:hypothetical protein
LAAILCSQERREARPSKLARPRQAAPGREQGLLQHVLSVLHRAEDLVAVQQELAPVGVGELAERLLVAGPGTGERA